MPEGPEVRNIAINLNKIYKSKTITNIIYSNNISSQIYNIECIISNLPLKINNITCKGKRIIFILINKSGKYFFIESFLAMEGKWLVNPLKHSYINIFLNDNSHLYYDDSRHFGKIYGYDNISSLITSLKKQGPDLLAYSIEYNNPKIRKYAVKYKITYEIWIKIIRNKRLENLQICQFLLEQKYFSGIGNYLKSEILYDSKIRPDRKIKSLSDNELNNIRLSILKIIYISFINNGFTIRTYIDPNNNKGNYKCLVYNQKYDPNGLPIIKSRFKDKRITYWVPDIQS